MSEISKPKIGRMTLFNTLVKYGNDNFVCAISRRIPSFQITSLSLQDLGVPPKLAASMVKLGDKALRQTLQSPDILTTYRRCQSCRTEFDIEDLDDEKEDCPFCGMDFVEITREVNLIKALRARYENAYQVFRDYTTVVPFDNLEGARLEDRRKVYLASRDQVLKRTSAVVAGYHFKMPSLNELMLFHKRRFLRAKTRLLEKYDELYDYTLAKNAESVLRIVLRIEDDEMIYILAKLIVEKYREYKESLPEEEEISLIDSPEMELPSQLSDWDLRITPREVPAFMSDGHPELLGKTPPRETIENALRDALIRKLDFTSRLIPSKEYLEANIQFYWSISSIDIPVGLAPGFDTVVQEKENELKKIQLDRDIAATQADRDQIVARAEAELENLVRTRQKSIEDAYRQTLDVAKAHHTRVVNFLEKELGDLLRHMMEKDEITIRHLPKVRRIERLVKNLQYFNHVVGSKRLDEISKDILRLVENAHDKNIDDDERTAQIDELQDFLRDSCEYLGKAKGRLERVVEIPTDESLSDIFDLDMPKIVAVRDVGTSKDIDLPVVEGTPRDTSKRI